MTRTELAALPEPKYLLYPHPGIYRCVMALPVIAFGAYLLWFLPELLAARTGLWHWVIFAFLGLMTVAILRPQARDWRNRITFAATPAGAWFVTNLTGDCEFVPWQRVGRVYADSLRSHNGAIKGVVFELDIDSTTWQRLNGGERHRFSLPRREAGGYKLGLSANLRKPAAIVAEVERLRALGNGGATPHLTA